MKYRAAFLLFSVALAGCPVVAPPNPPPSTKFYYPTGLFHYPVAGKEGLLFVDSSSFDRRYDRAAVIGLDLSELGLPAFGAPVDASGPKQIGDLKVTDGHQVYIDRFGGEMAGAPLAAGGVRLFVPTRSEDVKLQSIDAVVDSNGSFSMHCAGDGSGDCRESSPSLVVNEKKAPYVPRAPGAIGVGVSPCTGPAPAGGALSCAVNVYVTHQLQADSPKGTGADPRGYLVRVDAENPTVITDESFIDIGLGGSYSVAVSPTWAFVSGRFYDSSVQPSAFLVRLVSRAGNSGTAGLENEFHVFDARGLALSSDNSKLFILGRSPDTLLIAQITGGTLGVPSLKLIRSVTLPREPTQVQVIARAGRPDLVAVTSSGAGVVSFYDDAVGDMVAEIPGVGLQPYALTVAPQAAGARVYVSNFADGRVAVIDVPDLNKPQTSRLVAHLGATQFCNQGAHTYDSLDCDGGTP